MITKVVRLDSRVPDQGSIDDAVRMIAQGGLVAFPTETVYGIAVNVSDAGSIEKAYSVKERDRGKPYTIHISSREDIYKYNVIMREQAAKLMERFWPGPLTIVLKVESFVGLPVARSFMETVVKFDSIGFRFPENVIARKLIEGCEFAVAAPSANLSGTRDPVTAQDVLADFDRKIEMVLDGGRTKYGLGSTVVSCVDEVYQILRQGVVSAAEIEETLK